MASMSLLTLCSQSPRRRALLKEFDIACDFIAPPFCEESVVFKGNAAEYVKEIAEGKAHSVAEKHPDRLLIAADTSVFFENQIYNKPLSFQDAKQMLQRFSGSMHAVYTGICILSPQKKKVVHACTKVFFNHVSESDIESYLSSTHWQDKAGSYSIQGFGSLLVREIQGCYYNVTGLPMGLVCHLLKEFGINLWLHVRTHRV